MRQSKNAISSSSGGTRMNFGKNLCKDNAIFIDLWWNSSSTINSLEEANDLESFLCAAKSKVRQWKKKLKYKTIKEMEKGD